MCQQIYNLDTVETFDKFYGGLNVALKTELKRFNITDLDTAIHLLSRIEDIHAKPASIRNDVPVAMDLNNVESEHIDDEHDLNFVQLSRP